MQIERIDVAGLAAATDELVDLIRACVDGGASLGFLAPMSETTARTHWEAVAPEISAGTRVVVVGRIDGRVVGSGQLRFETKENGRHRAEVAKVMVHPSHRRLGLARLLMDDLEHRATEAGIALLYLDTSEGPGGARPLYESLGWHHAGGVPGYALDPNGTPADNAIFYKWLSEPASGAVRHDV